MPIYGLERTRVITGSYVGDGTTSQSITGLGRVLSLEVWNRSNLTNQVVFIFKTNIQMIADGGQGMAIIVSSGSTQTTSGRIVSLDDDGFTVSDKETDAHPNQDGQNYCYQATVIVPQI